MACAATTTSRRAATPRPRKTRTITTQKPEEANAGDPVVLANLVLDILVLIHGQLLRDGQPDRAAVIREAYFAGQHRFGLPEAPLDAPQAS